MHICRHVRCLGSTRSMERYEQYLTFLEVHRPYATSTSEHSVSIGIGAAHSWRWQWRWQWPMWESNQGGVSKMEHDTDKDPL